MQVKILPVTAVHLDAGKVEFVTNVRATKSRSQPVVQVLMLNPSTSSTSQLLGMSTVKFMLQLFISLYFYYLIISMSHVQWLCGLKCLMFDI